MSFTEDQIQRYARHILLPGVGGEGQAKLLGSRVLAIGAGGLGSPVMMYLAAAGVGAIGVIDDDVADLSNLQRQIIHSTEDVGRAKVESARETIARINPEVTVEAHRARLTADNALDLIRRYQLVADGSDNFATRYLVGDACHLVGRTLISAAMLRFDGQLSTFKSHLGHGEDGSENPCYRCLFPEAPPPGTIPSCAEAGIFGALAGAVGGMQATEILKELLGVGESLSGSLLLYDSLGTEFRRIRIKPDPACPLCGARPTIADLSGHAEDAGVCVA